MNVARVRRSCVALVTALCFWSTGPTAVAGWAPTAPPVSGTEPIVDVTAAAGPTGVAVVAWSDGVSVRAAVKEAGSGTFGAPVEVGAGSEVDALATPAGEILVGRLEAGSVRVARRVSAGTGFADVPMTLPGCDDGLQIALTATTRLALKARCSNSVTVMAGPLGGISTQSGAFGSSSAFTSSDMALAPGGGSAWIAMTARGTSSTYARLGRVLIPGAPDVNDVFETLNDSGSMVVTRATSSQATVADATGVPVMAWVTRTISSFSGVALSGSAALRTHVDPDTGPAVNATVQSVDVDPFFPGAEPQGPTLLARPSGTVTLAWSVTSPIGGTAVRTASLAPGATSFATPADVPGVVPAPGSRSAPDLASLAGDRLLLVAAGPDAVTASLASPGEGFGPPVTLTAGVAEPGPVTIHADGAGGALALWTQGDGGARRALVGLYDEEPPALGQVDIPSSAIGGKSLSFSAAVTDRFTGATAAWDFGDGSPPSVGSPVDHVYRADGTYVVVVRARDAVGNQSPAVERVVRVTGAPRPPATPGAAPPADRTAPVITGLNLTARRFAVAAAGRRTVVRRGTRVRFRLSEPATVTMTVARLSRGYRNGRACSPRKPRRTAKPRRCTLAKAVGAVSRPSVRGANTVTFTGRIRGRALPPASYRLTLVARDTARNRSKARAVSFGIVRPPRARTGTREPSAVR